MYISCLGKRQVIVLQVARLFLMHCFANLIYLVRSSKGKNMSMTLFGFKPFNLYSKTEWTRQATKKISVLMVNRTSFIALVLSQKNVIFWIWHYLLFPLQPLMRTPISHVATLFISSKTRPSSFIFCFDSFCQTKCFLISHQMRVVHPMSGQC